MPLYDYRCRTCGTVYEERRAMGDADGPTTCPAGHSGATRLLPAFAATGSAAEPAGCGFAGAGRSGRSGGGAAAGGCGAGCPCHAG